MKTYVTLSVCDETYAVPAASVQELVVLQALTPVPTAPPSIRGLMNLRGTVVPVVDLARQLGLGETAIQSQTCVVIVEVSDGARSAMGVLANDLREVVEIASDDITPAPVFGSRVPPAYIAGVARIAGQYALVLALEKILSADELLAATAAAEASS